MDAFIARCCLSILLFTSIGTRASSSETNTDEPREPRVSGRIVKLYSGAKPEPYFCTNEGFQADPLNCAVFYRCVKERNGKFTVFRYQCAPGTVYDPDVETCNHAHSTRRSECGGMLKPTTAESSQAANINEIVGAQSEVPRPISTKVPIYTEQTTYKNPTTLSWIHPTKVPWGATVHNAQNTLGTSQHKTTAFSSSTSGYQWSKSTQHKPENEHSSKTTSAPKITQQSNLLNNEPCTSDGFMGDSENCRKFYRCVGNQRGSYLKYEFSCSETTVWDDEIQGCNHPWAVKRGKCGRSLSYDDKTEAQLSTDPTGRTTTKENNEKYEHKSNKTIQQQLQISHGTKVIQTQTQISNSDEVIQNQTQINYHDQNNNIKKAESKQNQKQTSYGTAVSQTQTQHDYGNKGVQTQLQVDHSKDSSQSQIQIQESTTTDTVTSQNINNGNNECSESGFMGDSNDCKKFYRCVNNGRGTYTKYQYFCGDGTVWDPEIEACNHAWAVKHCGGRLPSESINEVHINTTTTTTIISTEYHTQPTTTTQSYYTSSQSADENDGDDIGYGNIQETTSSKTTREPTIKTTTTTISTTTTRPTITTETSTTEKSDGTTNECKSSGFIGDTNDCKIFYRCVDNGGGGFTKYEFKCGDGTLWDPDIEACNHAWAVKNCGGNTSSNEVKEETTTKKENTMPPQNIPETTVTLTQITTQVSTQITDTGYGSQTHEPSTTIRTTTQSPKQETNKNSKCKSSGFQGDENDCKKFYRCVDDGNGSFIKYEFTCGEGTVWDSKIEACNHAWAVEQCGEISNVTENTETTSQSIPTTSTSDTDSTQTTQGNKDTIKPVSTTITSTTSSTVHSVTSNKCSNSGFMGDYSDCKKFYRCVDNGDGSYNRFEFTCGEGTVWDPKIEACNHAWAVENCGGSNALPHTTQQTISEHSILQDEEQENGYATPSHDSFETSQTTTSTSLSSTTTLGETGHCHHSGFMGDQKDCKKFYRCVDNGNGGYDKYEFQCGEGTVWDGSIEACNHAWAVKDCRLSGSNITRQNESTTQSITSSVAFEDGQSQQPTEKTTTVSEIHHETVAGDQCVQAGFFGSQKDCKKFYRCVDNGKGGLSKYEFTCGEGTFWNQDIEGCDHTTADKPCGIMSQDQTNLNDDMVVQTTSTTKITTSTEKSGIESTQATKQPQYSQGSCESEGFHGNPLDCKKFYRCVDNGNGHYIKYDFSCGDGTIWNQDIQACDHESADKTCSGNSSTESLATDYQSTSTTSSYSTTKKEATSKIPSQATESECTSEGFFAHPNECKKFIRCVNNGNGGYTRYEFSCGDGTVWVQEIQACDHDNEVASCSAQNISTSKPQSTVEHSAVISESSVISSTESIAPNKENDEYDHESPKQPSHDESEDCTDEGYFGNKQDCKRFYRCVDNGNGGYTKYDFVCGDGTAWDSNLQTCNHINEVQSCSESSHESSENYQSTTNKNQAETESSSSTTKQPTTYSSESSSVSNSKSQGTCEHEGYFGDSKDCKKFYRCVDNGNGGYTKYDFTCGDGTIWDKDITTCNHPQDVSNPSCTPVHETGDTSSTTTSTTHSSQTTSSTTVSSSSSQCTSDCTQESAKKPENNVTCDKAGYYANPNDCKKFYRCVDWDGDGNKFSVFNFECGEGTIWDPALDTCNHEESVYPQRNCSQTQSQNVGGETTTSEGTTSTAIEQTTQVQTTSQAPATTSATEQTTTQQPTTSEKTTTQESTTNESTTPQQTTTSTTTTTTHQPTTSEKTTTQQPTTTESTTQQTTTSEKTTTQETTTSEQTTTQQSTTSEQTTTKEPTTSEKTTTQQFTSSETSPTQEPTTSEQTTTQQSPTNEPTTAQQSTTSEKTTTQESTTIESTTNQPATTTDQTTTQESTTREQTQQTTTTAQTTTESTTSEQVTTQQPTTTEQTTTQESTTREQTTTQQSTTTEQTTTQESNTSEQTTQESTTLTEGTTSTEGTTTTEETTDQSSTQTSSTESDTEGQTTTESSSTSEKDCPETDNDQYLLVCPTSFKRHPKYCNMFYQCTEDDDTNEAKVASFKCPNNTIYDENKTQCVTEDKADEKCNGEIANKRRFKRLGLNYKEPIIADKGKQSCSGTGHYSFEKSSECSKGFLKCERSKNGQLQGYVYQCPDGFIFWSISKRCERMENVRDCKKSINDWTGRWNIPVERKNVAAS